jgi:hypothetical protein
MVLPGLRKQPLLEKAAQKFLLLWATGVVPDNAHGSKEQSFFATFCSQKVAFLTLRAR